MRRTEVGCIGANPPIVTERWDSMSVALELFTAPDGALTGEQIWEAIHDR